MLYLEFGLSYKGPQGFYCKDPSLSFPFRGDTITIAALLVVAIIIPLLLFVTVETIREEPFWRTKARVIWIWFKHYLIFMYINLLLVEAAKVAVGEHRPHFLTTCVPDTGKTCEPGAYVQEYTCTNKEFSRYFQADTSRSFPSGHSSMASFLAIFCAVSQTMTWKLNHIFNEYHVCLKPALLTLSNFQAYLQQRFPTRRLGEVLKYLLITIFLLWGCLCSLSRITDRRHHWWDVLAGVFLGIACAIYGLFMVRKEKTTVKRPPRTSPSTTTLLDEKNKDATSIAI